MTSVLRDSPIDLIEGAKRTFVLQYPWASTVTGPTVAAYKGTTAYTATAFPSGSASASGTNVTLPELVVTDGDGGKKYSIVVTATVDGDTDVRKFTINVITKEKV